MFVEPAVMKPIGGAGGGRGTGVTGIAHWRAENSVIPLHVEGICCQPGNCRRAGIPARLTEARDLDSVTVSARCFAPPRRSARAAGMRTSKRTGWPNCEPWFTRTVSKAVIARRPLSSRMSRRARAPIRARIRQLAGKAGNAGDSQRPLVRSGWRAVDLDVRQRCRLGERQRCSQCGDRQRGEQHRQAVVTHAASSRWLKRWQSRAA